MRRVARNKYGNQQTVVDGITFDSKLEADYYVHLKALQKVGKIKSFKRQVKFELVAKYKQPETQKTIRSASYVVDFVVELLDGKERFIDTKGKETSEFKLKKKLFETIYRQRLVLVKKIGKRWEEL